MARGSPNVEPRHDAHHLQATIHIGMVARLAKEVEPVLLTE